MPRREADEAPDEEPGGRAAKRLQEFEALRSGGELDDEPFDDIAPPTGEQPFSAESDTDDDVAQEPTSDDDVAEEATTTADPATEDAITTHGQFDLNAEGVCPDEECDSP